MSVSLRDNLALTFLAKKELFTAGYGTPYMVFSFNGKEVTMQVDVSKSDDTFYAFTYPDISPQQIGDGVTGTMYVRNGDVLIKGKTQTYSVQSYCEKSLKNKTTKNELYTLLVDLLNYGEAAQEYVDYRTDAPVNANLTDLQRTWATNGRTYDSVYAPDGEAAMTDARFKNVGLVLSETVAIRYGFRAPNGVSGVTLKVEDGQEHSWTFGESDFVRDETDPTIYYVTFRGLAANRMSERVLATLWKDGKQSKSMSYSIETYASTIKEEDDAALYKLVNCMMRYGDAAKKYHP